MKSSKGEKKKKEKKLARELREKECTSVTDQQLLAISYSGLSLHCLSSLHSLTWHTPTKLDEKKSSLYSQPLYMRSHTIIISIFKHLLYILYKHFSFSVVKYAIAVAFRCILIRVDMASVLIAGLSQTSAFLTDVISFGLYTLKVWQRPAECGLSACCIDNSYLLNERIRMCVNITNLHFLCTERGDELQSAHKIAVLEVHTGLKVWK